MDTDLPQDRNLFQDKEPTLFNSRLILFFVAVTLFIALLNRLNDLSLLALLVLITMGGAKTWSALSLGRVTCKTEADHKRVFAGETLSMTTTVTNKKFLPVWVRLEWPESHMAVVKEKAKSSTREAGILWYQQACFPQTLEARRRGVYTAGPTHMRTSDLFGFFRAEKKLHQANTIIVYPKLVNLKKMGLPRRDLFGKPGSQHPVKDPVYITGTRDYQASSPARHIHWKASARHARLQEKVFEPSQQGKIMVVLDVHGFSDKGLKDGFERTLEVIASLCLQIEQSGMALGFATNGATAGGNFSMTPTGQGPQQVPYVLEALARVEMKPAKTLVQTMQTAVLTARGISCICFACEYTSELDDMRRVCRQKKIPLDMFVFRQHAASSAAESKTDTSIPLTRELLATKAVKI